MLPWPRLGFQSPMGKGRRRKWRASEVGDVEEHVNQTQEEAPFVNKSDDALFYIDNTGSRESRKNKKRRIQAGLEPKKKLPTQQKVIQPSQPAQTTIAKKKRGKKHIIDPWDDSKHIIPHETVKGFDAAPRPVPKPMRRAPTKPELFDKLGSSLKVTDEGLSVNPAPTAQQKILKQALSVHEKQLEENQKYVKKLRGEDLPALPEVASLEEIEIDNDVRAPAQKKSRKTSTQRNKERRKKEAKHKRNKEATQKQLLKQINNLPTIVAEIHKTTEEQKAQRVAIAAKKAASEGKVKLGKHTIKEPFPEVVLTEDVSGSLRQTKTKPTLRSIDDQFRLFQKKNLIEPQLKHNLSRRYKLKEYTRRAHRLADD
eukprot:g6180.t1